MLPGSTRLRPVVFIQVLLLSNSVQYFPLISVQLFPLFQLSEGDFYAV